MSALSIAWLAKLEEQGWSVEAEVGSYLHSCIGTDPSVDEDVSCLKPVAVEVEPADAWHWGANPLNSIETRGPGG